MSEVPFVKMHGIGNDYVFVDDRAGIVRDPVSLARQVADRHTGIGSDGLILLLAPTPGTGADVRMRMFNADGSEAEMCGNGIRCVCKLAHDKGISTAHPLRVETAVGVRSLEYTTRDGLVDAVTVNMGPPELEPSRIPVILPAGDERVIDRVLSELSGAGLDASWMTACGLDDSWSVVSVGNPHLILWCMNLEAVPLDAVGPVLECHERFPQRVNVHFVEVDTPDSVTMRTWERGSGITRACGSGASAVCVAGALGGRTEREIVARLPGGALGLRWDETAGHVLMTGPAVEVFSGVWPLTPATVGRTSASRPVGSAREA